MGVKKKPAVIAKTATKKRGRPVGSKNKPKHLGDLPLGTVLTADELFDRIEKMEPVSSKGWVPPKLVDWKSLAQRLQEALATEMRLTQKYEKAGFFARLSFLFTGKI